MTSIVEFMAIDTLAKLNAAASRPSPGSVGLARKLAAREAQLRQMEEQYMRAAADRAGAVSVVDGMLDELRQEQQLPGYRPTPGAKRKLSDPANQAARHAQYDRAAQAELTHMSGGRLRHLPVATNP